MTAELFNQFLPTAIKDAELPRPVAWLCQYRSGEEFASLAADPMLDPDVMSAVPLVTQSSCTAAVVAELEWCAQLCDTLRSAWLTAHPKSTHGPFDGGRLGALEQVATSIRERLEERTT